jgi:hypothetical protein
MKSIVALFLLTSLAAAQQPSSSSAASGSAPAKASDTSQPAPRKVDKAAAYYHFTMAHMYEEEWAQRSGDQGD